jgi:hypothetical protein
MTENGIGSVNALSSRTEEGNVSAMIEKEAALERAC